MSRFYDDFKFAVESCGLPAPTSEFFNLPLTAATNLAAACGALDSLGTAATFNLNNFVAYGKYLKFLKTIPLETRVLVSPSNPATKAGQAAINILKNTPKSTLVFKAGVYVGGCLAAAYFGVLTGAAAYATIEYMKRLTGFDKAFDFNFFHWWYGGYEADQLNIELRQRLQQKQAELNMLKASEKKVHKILLHK